MSVVKKKRDNVTSAIRRKGSKRFFLCAIVGSCVFFEHLAYPVVPLCGLLYSNEQEFFWLESKATVTAILKPH